MKIQLFIALLVLIASTNVYGQNTDKPVRKGERGRRPEGERPASVSSTPSNLGVDDVQGEPAALTTTLPTDLPAASVDQVNTPNQPPIQNDQPPMQDDRQPMQDDQPRQPEAQSEAAQDQAAPADPAQSLKPQTLPSESSPVADAPITLDVKQGGPISQAINSDAQEQSLVNGNKAMVNKPSSQTLENSDELPPNAPAIAGNPKPVGPSEDSVHVTGNIVVVNFQSSVVRTVQYEVEGAHSSVESVARNQPVTSLVQDYLAPKSEMTLYVSTSKTLDPKLAFAKFPVAITNDHFPVPFEIDVELPNQQRGLVQRGDITLYFFAYVSNLETRVQTFLPAGISQILLQGTNRLIQKLDVSVRLSGIEVSGLFKSRFGPRYIPSGTTFYIRIVSEENLLARYERPVESVAELTINNVPSMFPVPFAINVNYQALTPNMKYFALGFVNENGQQRLINQEPIWVINEQQILVTPQVVFTVIPSPLILRGTVTRSMPGAFIVQPRSSLVLRLHEIGSDSQDIIYKLPEIGSLPQVFQVNISQALRFDPSKNYDMRALILDEQNNIYMATLQPIPLPDENMRLLVPVDDLLHFVQCNIQPSSNQQLTYIPGSVAQILVTDSPDNPIKPIAAERIDNIPNDFREFSIRVPTTAIERDRNYYLVMMIEINGVITHLSTSLLISNNQPPPLVIQVPLIPLNLLTGVLFDTDNRQAQWSSSSRASIYLVEDKPVNPDKAIVQQWNVNLENDFPVRFQVSLDFSLLDPNRVYRLQAAIENSRQLLEYKPAGSVLVFSPGAAIVTDLRIPVRSVKTSQLVEGLIYINDIQGALPEKGEIIIQLSSSPSLTNPTIIDEIRLNVDQKQAPVPFKMDLLLNKIDITSVYYFLVSYVVNGNVIIPASQAFAFSPRNQAAVVITLSKTPQIPITGQITSTGSPLLLPAGATMHLYITDNIDENKPLIFSEVFLQSSPNSLYEFTMNIDSIIIQKKIPLYLRADILYQDEIILSMPRPALLQITLGGEWNINLVVNLPTLLTGDITSTTSLEKVGNDFDLHIEIVDRERPTALLQTFQMRLDTGFPHKFRVQLDNSLFLSAQSAGAGQSVVVDNSVNVNVNAPRLQARAVIKNCKGQVLFGPAAAVDIHVGVNVGIKLPVTLTNPAALTDIAERVDGGVSIRAGDWKLSVTGVTRSLTLEK